MDNKIEINQTVYISYNNNDSSVSSFISYLVTSLHCLGIVALSEKTGHKLESTRFSNIKLSLVVFSNSYVFSVACLENLVKLFEFLQQGHVVVPVIYDAAATQQMEMSVEAFSTLRKSYSADQVTKWRCALTEIMKLQGHGYTNELRYESDLIEKIAEDVYEKLFPTEHIGIHKVLVELQNLLCKQAWGIRSIGIFGEPGVGKTTLAKALFCRTVGDYDDSRFIKEFNENIFDLFSDDDIQEVLMEKFDLNNPDAEPCYRQKRLLFALDDVRNAQDVEAFLCDFYQFGPGSLLIITSRNRQVLEECHVNEIYELKGLSDEDALKLFTRCLSGQDGIEEKLTEVSLRDLERCDGNPSTIRSCAEMIKSKKTAEMDADLGMICHDLLTYPEDRFFINLKQSYSSTEATHNYQSDIEKLPGLDLASGFFESIFTGLKVPCLNHDSVQTSFFCASSNNDISNLTDLPTIGCGSRSLESLSGDQRILSLGQESLSRQFQRRQLIILKGLAYQLNKLWEGYKSFSRLRSIKFGHFEKLVEIEAISEAHNLEEIDLRDCTSLKRIPVIDQLKHLQILNLSGCTGIEHFPDNIPTINELNLEGTGIMEIRCEEKGFSKLAKQQSTTTTLLLTRRA